MTDNVKIKTELIFNLMKANPKDLTPMELHDILELVSEEPSKQIYERHSVLRKRVSKVLSSKEWMECFAVDQKEMVVELLVDIAAIDARTDFYSFVKLMAESVIPNEFKDGRHIQVICEHLQHLYDSYERYQDNPKEKADRLQVFLPPRSMKSVLCSILFPAWVLGRNPKYRILLVGNSANNAADTFGRPLRNLVLSDEYRTLFPDTVMDPKASSTQRFFTMAGGGFACAGAQTAVAGKGGDFIICDDLLSEQTAFSKVERTKINNNYIPGIRSRCQPGAGELIINTRWHLDDLSGFLIGVDGNAKDKKPKTKRPWKVISIPAILDEDASEVLRKPYDKPDDYKAGSSYWPEYKPLDDLEELKKNYIQTEPYKWSALYMQNPVPEEGGVVKHEDWKDYTLDKTPRLSQVVVVFDTAFAKTQRADYTAYTVWGIFHQKVETVNGIQEIPQALLLYAEKGKWDFFELCEKCEYLRNESPWRPDYYIVEKKASGQSLLQELIRRGFPVVEFDPRGTKEERLQAAAVIMRMGRVHAPKEKDWAMDVIEEVCNFPSAPNDDYTDTVSMLVVYLRDMGVLRHEGYEYIDEIEAEFEAQADQQDPKTYWSAITGEYHSY